MSPKGKIGKGYRRVLELGWMTLRQQLPGIGQINTLDFRAEQEEGHNANLGVLALYFALESLSASCYFDK